MQKYESAFKHRFRFGAYFATKELAITLGLVLLMASHVVADESEVLLKESTAQLEESHLATVDVPRSEASWDRLHAVLDHAHLLADSGAGYEAASVVAAIADIDDDSDLGHEARERLEAWGLTINDVRSKSIEEINHRVREAVKPGNRQTDTKAISHAHVRNLIRLGHGLVAAEYVKGRLRDAQPDESQRRVSELLSELHVRPTEVEQDDALRGLAQTFANVYARLQLQHRAHSLWQMDHEAAEIARAMLHHLWGHERHHDEGDDEEGAFERFVVRRDEAEESHERDDEDRHHTNVRNEKRELVANAIRRCMIISEEAPEAALILAQIAAELTEDSLAQTTANNIVERLNQKRETQSSQLKTPKSSKPAHDQTNPAMVPSRVASSDYTDLFDQVTVRDYQLELSEDAINSLRAAPKKYVRGCFLEGDTKYEDVGVRLKGGWGSFRMINEHSKAAFTVKFNQFRKEQRFHGARRIVLNNAAQDPSYLHEHIGYSLFRDAGVPAPRTNFAQLQVNGEDYGLYVQVEAVTQDFLKSWFEDHRGNLYEGPGDVSHWEELDADTNQEKSNRSDLRTLANAIETADDDTPWSTIRDHVDEEKFARFLALEQLVHHWDGYTQVNNYRLYRDPTSHRFHFFPHGCDQIFEEPGESIFRQQGGIMGRAMLQTVDGKQRFKRTVGQLLEQVWNEQRIRERIAEAYITIYPHVLATKGRSEHDVHAFDEMVAHLIHFIHVRRSAVETQLRRSEAKDSWRVHREFEYHLPSMEW